MTIAIDGPRGFHTSVVEGLTASSTGCATTANATVCGLTIGGFKPCVKARCYVATVKTYDAVRCTTRCAIPPTARVLSGAQHVAFDVAPGKPNALTFSLGGLPAAISVSPLAPGYLQGDASSLRVWGPQAQSLAVVPLDADGNPIVGAGAPSITASSGGGTLAVTNPAAASSNVITLRATTSGSPAAVTPGVVNLALTATPAAGSGGSAVRASVPVTIAHSGVYIAGTAYIAIYYDGNVGATPNATIAGSNTGFSSTDISGIAVDSRGTIYVCVPGSSSSIEEFADGANGNVAPIAAISGANTGLSYSSGVAVDSSGTVYVANATSPADISEYAPGSNGNVGAKTYIFGALTLLSSPTSIAFDASGNAYVASGNNGVISIFAPGASGNQLFNLIAGPNTKMKSPTWVTVLPDGTVAAVETFLTTGPALLEYAPGASGNVSPAVTIAGGATNLESISGIAADANGTIYVVDNNWVTEYARTASGNAAPIATITPPILGATDRVAVVPAANAP
jgi:sugar lactone lactonase YvrE